jgi:hypothetical protein
MFDSADKIRDVVDVLMARQASVWHACQLNDFESYLQLGGVPSRQRLEAGRVRFTAFQSDADDRAHRVWDKVFFNLGDFGRPFAWGRRAIPNVYGPIALQFGPGALSEATDVAVCLRSASSRGFDREAESLQTADEVEQLFDFPLEVGFPRTMDIKYGDSLRSSFPFAKDAQRPEISCSTTSGAVTFRDLVVIWVDPVEAGGVSLKDRVTSALDTAGLDVKVHERSMMSERRSVLGDVVNELGHGFVQLRLLPGRHGVSNETRDWVDGVRALELDWLWDRYAQYLIEGTLGSMGGVSTPTMHVMTTRPSAPRPTRVAEILEGLKEH